VGVQWQVQGYKDAEKKLMTALWQDSVHLRRLQYSAKLSSG
jgi:hypothetical protein